MRGNLSIITVIMAKWKDMLDKVAGTLQAGFQRVRFTPVFTG